MKIIPQLVILTLSSLLVGALDDDELGDEYCETLISECKQNFTSLCAHRNYAINTCCDLKIFESPSGIYKIKIEEFETRYVYCDMDTDGGGWIVVQRNKQGSEVDFNRKWDEYETGFGDLKGEFWYGLKGLSCLTQSDKWEMRLDYQKSDKTWSYLHYSQFKVETANEKYRLTATGFTQKTSDLLAKISGQRFSTPDSDNDQYRYANCAHSYSSGWWYYHDCGSELNINRAPPYVGGNVEFTEMKIRHKDCLPFE